MKKQQIYYQKVNPVIRYSMISTLSIIFITLLGSWLVWLFFYRNIIEVVLVNFSFSNFSIIILTFSAISLFFVFAFFLIKKRSIYLNIFSLLSFNLTILIAILSFFFFVKISHDFLIIGLPWIIIISATFFLFIFSIINLILTNQEIQEVLISNQNKINSEVKLLTNPANTTSLLKKASIEIEKEALTNLLFEDKSFNSILLQEDHKKILELPFSSENIMQEEKITSVVVNDKVKEITKWTKKQIKQVWDKSAIIPGVNKQLYRKDYAGAWMFFPDFINNLNEKNFNINSYSWTIIQHKPLAKQGTNELDNLTPMNIINAISKAENYPKWKTKVSSYGNENIVKEQIWSD